MMADALLHETVLLHEAIDGLAIKPEGIYIDATFGRGGHSRLLLSKLGPEGRLIAIDRDPQAIAEAQKITDPRFEIVHAPFSQLAELIATKQLHRRLDGILFDLGVSSPQLDDPERGFSFLRDGPLDMRMDPTRGISAAQWLEKAAVDDIAWVLKNLGEERFAYRIAKAIELDRQTQPYTRTKALADMIARVVPNKEKNKHPATRSFQAIRMYINSELDEIENALTASIDALTAGGRLAVISFHSLEDRLVKHFIRKQQQGPEIPDGLPITDAELAHHCTLKAVGKAIRASDTEVFENTRSRSAVLRLAQRLETQGH